MTNFNSAFEQVIILVEDFQSNESKYLSPDYSEASVRTDFIDKFFDSLGWDVYHNEQRNPYEQEVKIEKGIYVGKQQKRADYAFHLAPNFRDVKFYAEAKKPSRNLSNADDYFQSIRYGWNAGTQITFLTDFQEFHILDCRIKPDISSILNYKIKKYHYSDFLNEEKFSEIYWLLSREAVVNNSLEKFAESLPKPKGKAILKGTHKGIYQSIDEAFLEELDEIRDSLAKAFKKANPQLESEPLTEMTQRLIDRLVFIRFLEDKQIEPDHYVSEFANSKSAWKDFRIASRKLDAKYNGVVFKKHAIDSDNFIAPDDKTFSLICEELAHVNSPYNFDIIPIHILGSIYERFLGKVVVATDKRVRIEEKPEVRKAGGVYYTPQYIVDYIVDNTVGKLIEGKTPKEISKMRFADISCGSGSFLITVFDRLLEHHRKWYQDNPEQAKKDGCYFLDGKWVLSLKQKQKILTNNVYGVDLDHQAVEVTQLSLYLKLLEDETTATAQDTWVMFKEQLLPNLNNNIVCGNSLIGRDIFENNLFNHHDEIKLKPMNFEEAFPEVMNPSASSGGGFNAIVGNPPYGAEFSKSNSKYFRDKYHTAKGELDSYALFLERTLSLIKKDNFIGFIVPDTWLTLINADELRKYIIENFSIIKLIRLNESVFKQATIDPLILVVRNSKPTEFQKTEVSIAHKKVKLTKINSELDTFTIQQNIWSKNKNYQIKIFSNERYGIVIEKLNNVSNKLSDLLEYKAGCKPYEKGKGKPPQTQKILDEKPYTAFKHIQKDWFKLIRGDDIKRYEMKIKKPEWISYGEWLAAPRDFRIFSVPRILVQAIRNPSLEKRILATYTEEIIISRINVYSLIKKTGKIDYKYILGILNSNLMNWFLKKDYGLHTYVITGILQLPVVTDDILGKSFGLFHDKLVQLVDQMLDSKKQLANAKTESEKEYLENKCSIIDRQIDQLVYELYGLTEEEIKIVEGNG